MYAIGTIVAAVAIAAYSFFKRNARGRRRSLSFNSIAMIQNSFPPEANVAEPIINALVLFEAIPTLEEIMQCSHKVANCSFNITDVTVCAFVIADDVL